jgi:hypothetical protein
MKYSIIQSMSERSDFSGWSRGKPIETGFPGTRAGGRISHYRRLDGAYRRSAGSVRIPYGCLIT